MCGSIIAYQYGALDAFRGYHNQGGIPLDGNYVSGVSITRGTPRQHVWTFVAARDQLITHNWSGCDCLRPNYPFPPTPPTLETTTSATLAAGIALIQIRSMATTLCGMGLVVNRFVTSKTPAAPSTTLHGSTSSCHSPPLMISSCESAGMLEVVHIFLSKNLRFTSSEKRLCSSPFKCA